MQTREGRPEQIGAIDPPCREVQVDKPRYLEWRPVHRVIRNDPTYHIHACRRQKLSRQSTSRWTGIAFQTSLSLTARANSQGLAQTFRLAFIREIDQRIVPFSIPRHRRHRRDPWKSGGISRNYVTEAGTASFPSFSFYFSDATSRAPRRDARIGRSLTQFRQIKFPMRQT